MMILTTGKKFRVHSSVENPEKRIKKYKHKYMCIMTGKPNASPRIYLSPRSRVIFGPHVSVEL